jgi:hypothetical protein
MADPEWRFPESSELFSEEVLDYENIALATLTVDADSDLAAELLLDPLPILIKNIQGVDESWSVSVDRVTAQYRVGGEAGPRKLVLSFLVLHSHQHVAALAHRVPERQPGA